VIGFSEVLSMETFGTIGSARNKDYINDIHASAVHLLALINDILDIARIDSGQAQLTEEVVDLKAVTAQALCMVTVQAEANNIALVENIDPEVRSVRADQRRLKQIIINLVGNAVKFTNPGGAVTIAAHSGAEGLVIEVIDTGIGIAAKDIPVALSYFGQIDSTLARKYEGTGLGLPLAKQLAELHGGKLTIESTPNVGTKVAITLPADRMVAPRTAAPAAVTFLERRQPVVAAARS